MKKLFLSSLLMLSSLLFAQNEITVTAERIDKSIETTQSPLQVFTSADFEKNGNQNLSEFLSTKTGIHFPQAGSYRGNSSAVLRGLPSGFTRIIIDDIELEDPSQVDSGYQIQFLDLHHIEKIEILSGTQSALYGTDSIGGVIKITTKRNPETSVQLGTGADQTQWGNFAAIQKHSIGNFRSFAKYFHTEGISQYSEKRSPGAERDSTDELQLWASFDFRFRSIQVEFGTYQFNSDSEIDRSTSDVVDNDLSSYQQQLYYSKFWGKACHDRWQWVVLSSATDITRVDQLNSGKFKSENYKLEWRNTLLWNENWTTLFGVESQSAVADVSGDFTKKENDASALYVIQDYQKNNWFTSLSLRNEFLDANDEEVLTYKYGLGRRLPWDFILKANVATGFKAPTLYQLNSTTVGNPNLESTESKNIDVTLQLEKEKFEFSSTYFYNDLSQMIDFDSTANKYLNIDEARTYGHEHALKIQLPWKMSWETDYTYTKSENKQTAQPLARVPTDKWNNSIYAQITDEFSSSIISHYTGSRIDSEFTNNYMPGYTLFDLALKYKLNQADLNLKFHNLFDKEYENVYGYQTRGFSVYGWANFIF